jgi:site-specific DNA recombinase
MAGNDSEAGSPENGRPGCGRLAMTTRHSDRRGSDRADVGAVGVGANLRGGLCRQLVRFRPGRSAHDALAEIRQHLQAGDVPAEEQTSICVSAIVSDELFRAVAEQLSANRRLGRERKRGARYLLRGLLECSCCGYAYYGKKVSRSSAKGKTPYAYYRCVGTDAYRFGGQRVCHNKQARTDRLDDAVWNDVRQLLHHPDMLANRIRAPAGVARR